MKSLRKALSLLNEFSKQEGTLAVGELATRTGLTRSHASRLLAEFAEAGVLIQDPKSRCYSVGLRTYVLGMRFINQDRLARESIPIMRKLMDVTGHSARLSVMDGDKVLYFLCMEGPLFVDTGFRAGTCLPIHSTSAGRVLLAFLHTEQVKRILSRAVLAKLTDGTVTDKRELTRMLEHVCLQGYATQRGETTTDLAAVTVPVFGSSQQVLAALTVALPVRLCSEKVESLLIEQLHNAARGISLRMGALAYPYGTAQGAIRYLSPQRNRPRR